MKPRILIFDDEAPIRTMFAFSLYRAGMRVSVAAGGDVALRVLEAGGQDCYVQAVRGHGYRLSGLC